MRARASKLTVESCWIEFDSCGVAVSRYEPPVGPPGPGPSGWHDPGWRPVLGRAARGLVPFVGRRWMQRAADGLAPILLLRAMFIAFTVPMLVLAAILFAIDFGGETPGSWVWLVQLAATVAAVGGFVWAQRFPFAAVGHGRLNVTDGSPADQRERLRQVYTARFFLAMTFAMTIPLLGFVASFINATVWHYLAGLGAAVLPMWILAPTRRRVAADDRRFTAAGVSNSLTEALVEPPDPSR